MNLEYMNISRLELNYRDKNNFFMIFKVFFFKNVHVHYNVHVQVYVNCTLLCVTLSISSTKFK